MKGEILLWTVLGILSLGCAALPGSDDIERWKAQTTATLHGLEEALGTVHETIGELGASPEALAKIAAIEKTLDVVSTEVDEFEAPGLSTTTAGGIGGAIVAALALVTKVFSLGFRLKRKVGALHGRIDGVIGPNS